MHFYAKAVEYAPGEGVLVEVDAPFKAGDVLAYRGASALTVHRTVGRIGLGMGKHRFLVGWPIPTL